MSKKSQNYRSVWRHNEITQVFFFFFLPSFSLLCLNSEKKICYCSSEFTRLLSQSECLITGNITSCQVYSNVTFAYTETVKDGKVIMSWYQRSNALFGAFGASFTEAYGRCMDIIATHCFQMCTFVYLLLVSTRYPKMIKGILPRSCKSCRWNVLFRMNRYCKRNLHSSFLLSSFYLDLEAALRWLTGLITSYIMGISHIQMKDLQTVSDY